MTRTGRVLSGLVFGYVNQGLVILVGLWVTAFLLGRLGQEAYGLWLVATKILGYLLLLDLGVVALLPRETAFATGRNATPAELSETVAETVRAVMWQLPIVALAAFGIWLGVPGEWAPLRAPLALVLAVFTLTFPTRILQATLNGLQDLGFLAASFTLSWAAGIATTIGLVIAGLGLYALAAGWGISQLLSGVTWWMRLRRRFPHVLPGRLGVARRDDLKERLARSRWITVSQVSQVLLQGTDLLIIGKLMGPEAVVPYFCTAKILTVLGHQPQLLAQTAQPALSELRVAVSRERILTATTALTTAVLIGSGAIVCVVLVVNEGFVRWWVGADQFIGFGVTAALLAAMMLRHWYMTAIYTLFAFGQDRRISLTTLADGLLTAVSSVALVLSLGWIGAALGSIAGVVFVGLPATAPRLARLMGLTPGQLFGPLLPWFWRFALVAVPSVALPLFWTPEGLAAVAAAAFVVLMIYGALMLPLMWHEPLGPYLRPRIESVRLTVMRALAAGEVQG